MIKWRFLKLLAPEEGEGGGDPSKEKTPNPEDKQHDLTNIELAKQVKALKEENSAKDKKIAELSDENKQLYEDFINGEGDGKGGNGQPAPNREALMKELEVEAKEILSINSAGMTNLELAKRSLSFRKKAMELGMPDPFLPKGHDLKPTDDDKEKAQHVAEVFEQCIEAANGDPDLFTAQLQARTNDDSNLIKNFMAKMKAQRKKQK